MRPLIFYQLVWHYHIRYITLLILAFKHIISIIGKRQSLLVYIRVTFMLFLSKIALCSLKYIVKWYLLLIYIMNFELLPLFDALGIMIWSNFNLPYIFKLILNLRYFRLFGLSKEIFLTFHSFYYLTIEEVLSFRENKL